MISPSEFIKDIEYALPSVVVNFVNISTKHIHVMQSGK